MLMYFITGVESCAQYVYNIIFCSASNFVLLYTCNASHLFDHAASRHQRKAREAARAASHSRSRSPNVGQQITDTRCHLLSGWLQDWAWGLLSSLRLQQYAARAVKDGNSHPLMARVANIGAGGGVTASNCNRTLMSMFVTADTRALITKIDGLCVNSVVHPHDTQPDLSCVAAYTFALLCSLLSKCSHISFIVQRQQISKS